MNNEELLKILRENLRINVTSEETGNVTVSVFFENELVCSDTCIL